MSPLEKVPFATFYPLQKYLRGTCFFQKRLFQVDSTINHHKHNGRDTRVSPGFSDVLRAAETFSDSTVPQQQQPKTRILSGTVLDAVTNEPVIGAAVQVRGRQGGEITDLDGMFTINVPSGAVITIPGWNPSYRIMAVSATGERTEVRP